MQRGSARISAFRQTTRTGANFTCTAPVASWVLLSGSYASAASSPTPPRVDFHSLRKPLTALLRLVDVSVAVGMKPMRLTGRRGYGCACSDEAVFGASVAPARPPDPRPEAGTNQPSPPCPARALTGR